MKIIGANITGSFILNNQDVTNTLQSSSVWSGSVAAEINSLNAASASLNSATASLSSATASLYAATASIYSATASLNTFTASAATTGSNTFNGNQIVSGSLTVTGSITTPGTLTAQTLVVQTVTSSTVYSSGSNIFGNNISNTQVLTGSVYMTGSLNTVGNAYLGGDVYATGGYGLYVKGDGFKELEITSNDDSTYFLMEAYKTSPTASDRATSEKYLDGYGTYDKVYFNNSTFGISAWKESNDNNADYRGRVDMWLPTVSNNSGSFSIRNYYNLNTNSLFTVKSNGTTLLNNATDNGVNTLQVSGSIFATSLTGSLLGTASNAVNAASASWITGSSVIGIVSNATSASFASTAASAPNYVPYSGATSTLDLNNRGLTNAFELVSNNWVRSENSLFIKNGAGARSTGYTAIGSLSDGTGLLIAPNTNYAASLIFQTAANYSYTFPTSSGTVALTTSTVDNATSASFATTAATASSADNLTVRNTLTAQTLVVQTITSSVDFVTGSTRFGTLSSNTHVFSGSVTMNPGGLFVSSSGRVGIGTTNPNTLLEITSATTQAWYRANRASTSFEAGLQLATAGTSSWYTGLRSADNTGSYHFYSYTAVASVAQITNDGNFLIGTVNGISGNSRQQLLVGGNSFGSLIALGNNGNANKFVIESDSSENVLINNKSNTPIIFYTSGSERMRILGGGNVGIGTTNPSYILDVASSTSSNLGRFIYTDGVYNPRIQITGDSTGITFYESYSTGANSIKFSIAGSNTLTLKGDYVGIGNTNPYSPFTLNGAAVSWGENATIYPASNGYITVAFRLEGADSTTGTWAIGKESSSSIGANTPQYFQIVKNSLTGGALHRVDAVQSFNPSTGNAAFGFSVGIGTTNPASSLHVYKDSDVWHARFGSSSGELRIGGATSSGAVIQSYTPGGSVRDLYIQRDGGKIGIGTTSPTATKLSLGQGIGAKFMVYDNPATGVYSGIGQDLDGGNSTDLFAHAYAGYGYLTFGKLGTNGSSYTQWAKIDPSGNFSLNGGQYQQGGVGIVQTVPIGPTATNISYSATVNTQITIGSASIPSNARWLLADIFITADISDHQNFMFTRNSIGSQKSWVNTRGGNPASEFGNLTGTDIAICTYYGESDGFSSNYGIWYSSKLIPSVGRTCYMNNYGNSNSNGYVYFIVRGYSL